MRVLVCGGEDRLVRSATPDTRPIDVAPTQPEPAQSERNGGGGNGGGHDLHPLIQGLLKELPEARTQWPTAKRKLWLATADSIFKLIYPSDEAEKERGIISK